MFNNFSNTKSLIKLLEGGSKVSSLEAPALLIGILTLIPGILDELIVSLGVFGVIAAVVFLRRLLKVRRDKFRSQITAARDEGSISETEFKRAMRALNVLTVPGGQQSNSLTSMHTNR